MPNLLVFCGAASIRSFRILCPWSHFRVRGTRVEWLICSACRLYLLEWVECDVPSEVIVDDIVSHRSVSWHVSTCLNGTEFIYNLSLCSRYSGPNKTAKKKNIFIIHKPNPNGLNLKWNFSQIFHAMHCDRSECMRSWSWREQTNATKLKLYFDRSEWAPRLKFEVEWSNKITFINFKKQNCKSLCVFLLFYQVNENNFARSFNFNFHVSQAFVSGNKNKQTQQNWNDNNFTDESLFGSRYLCWHLERSNAIVYVQNKKFITHAFDMISRHELNEMCTFDSFGCRVLPKRSKINKRTNKLKWPFAVCVSHGVATVSIFDFAVHR